MRTSWSRSSATRRGVARYEYGLRNDQYRDSSRLIVAPLTYDITYAIFSAMTSPTTKPSARPVARPDDGRALRSERSRRAIVDAMLAWVDDGVAEPTAQQIADRAGVGIRSV